MASLNVNREREKRVKKRDTEIQRDTKRQKSKYSPEPIKIK